MTNTKTTLITFGVGIGAAVAALCAELIFASFAQWDALLPAGSGNDLLTQSLGIIAIIAIIEESALYTAISLVRPLRSFLSVLLVTAGFSLIEISLPILATQPRQEVFLHFAPILLLHFATLALYASWHLGSRRFSLIPGILLHVIFNVAISDDNHILLPLAITLSGATLVCSYLAYLHEIRYTEDEIR